MSDTKADVLGDERGTWPEVSIIVLNWNNYEDTAACLDSVRGLNYPNHRAIVVDNASTDASRERLDEEYEWCEFVLNDENLGFARGCNRGIERVKVDSEYVLLLNNDCRFLDSDALTNAVKLAECKPDAGIVGGKIYYSGSNKIWSACGEINWLRGRGVHFGHDKHDSGEFDEVTEVELVSGALMLVKSEVFETVGLLPENYFFGAEEWDFSVQVRRAGYSLYYCPKFEVEHEVGASHDTFDLRFVYNTYRNKLIFQQRNLQTWTWRLWLTLFYVYLYTVLRFNLRRQIDNSEENAELDEVIGAIREAVHDHRQKPLIVEKEDIEQFGELE